MKKIKVLGIITLLSIVLVSCNGNEKKEISKRDSNRQIEETSETVEVKNSPIDNTVNKKMNKDDIEDLYDLLEDTGEIKDRDLNNEYELVELAEDWITELAEMNIDNEEIRTYTSEWLGRENNVRVSRFKEVFPKLNDYAMGLIKGDPKTLELYRNSDDDRNEVLDDLIIDENQWTEVFNTIISTIE